METFHIYDLLTFLQELVGESVCLIEITACIAAKVKYQ